MTQKSDDGSENEANSTDDAIDNAENSATDNTENQFDPAEDVNDNDAADSSMDNAPEESDGQITFLGGGGTDIIEPDSDGDYDSLDSGSDDEDLIDDESEGGDVIRTGSGEDTFEVSDGGDAMINHGSGDDAIEVDQPDQSEPSSPDDGSNADSITEWGVDPSVDPVEDFLEALSAGFWTQKSKRMKIARGVFTNGLDKQRVPGVEFASNGGLESDAQVDDLLEQLSGFSTRKVTRLLFQPTPDLF